MSDKTSNSKISSESLKSNGAAKEELDDVDYGAEPREDAYAWLVALGCWMIFLTLPMPRPIFGIMYARLLMKEDVSTATTATIYALQLVAWGTTGSCAGSLCTIFEWRKVAFFGCFISGLATVISAFATEAWHLIPLYSIMFGMGLGCVVPTSVFVLTSYFKRRRGFVLGMMTVCTSTAFFLSPIILTFLSGFFGYRGATLIIGALMWHGCAASMLFRPVQHSTNKRKMSRDVGIDCNQNGNKNTPELENDLASRNNSAVSFTKNNYQYEQSLSNTTKTLRSDENRIIMETSSSEDFSGNKKPKDSLVNRSSSARVKKDDELQSNHFSELTNLVAMKTTIPKDTQDVDSCSHFPLIRKCKSDSDFEAYSRASSPHFVNRSNENNQYLSLENNVLPTGGKSHSSRKTFNFVRGTATAEEDEAPTDSIQILSSPRSEKDSFKLNVTDTHKTEQKSPLREFFSFLWQSLLFVKSHRLKIMAFSAGSLTAANSNGTVMIPFVLKERGYTLEETAWVISLSAILNIVGRITTALSIDHMKFSKRYVYMFGSFCVAVGLCIFALTAMWNPVVIGLSLLTMGNGCCIAIEIPVLVDIMGAELLPKAYCVNEIILSLTPFIAGLIFGAIRDYTKNFTLTLMLLSGTGLIPCILYSLMPLAIKSDRKRNCAQC